MDSEALATAVGVTGVGVAVADVKRVGAGCIVAVIIMPIL